MATIINSAWKSKKTGTTVTFKGEEYEIGSTAFATIEAAVDAGETSDLVIVDKKLTSPVKKQNITGAATDIFASTYKETDSADGKTHTETVKFTAAAGGTASFKDEDAELIGFEKITGNDAGGTFAGGKLDISSSLKTVSDSDKGIESLDETATVNSTATGSLTVTGKANTPSVTVATIADSEGNIDKAASIVKDAYKEASGEDYEDHAGATYASVTLKKADLTSDINGGAFTEKATIKTSDTNGEKINKEYSYSATEKTGSGAATLTDANAQDIVGFKTVKITTSAAAAHVGDIAAGNGSIEYSKKSAYVADKSFTYNSSEKETDAVAGSLTVTGKSGKEVEVAGEIEGFSSVNLKYATVTGEIDTKAASETSTAAISVKPQKDDAALTASFSKADTKTADGSLTAANSFLKKNLDGVKTVAISNTQLGDGSPINADATNVKAKTTQKVTGVATAGITDNAEDYYGAFSELTRDWAVAADWEKAYTFEYSDKVENSVGGTSFKVTGKADAASDIAVSGYKTVALDNTNTDPLLKLTATLGNDSSVEDTQEKESFTPESAYSYTKKETTTDKAVGDATIKGMTTASVDGFASVKVSGTAGKTNLTGVAGETTYSYTKNKGWTIKPGKDNPIGNYTKSETESSKAATTLDVSKAGLSGVFSDLKSAKLQNVTGSGAFTGAVDLDEKINEKFTWKADEISGDEVPATDISDNRITAGSYSKDTKRSAAGAFSLKNASEDVTVTAVGFKTVDVTGKNTTTKLGGVTGQDTYTRKYSESLSVNGAKGTYSDSETQSTKAATALTVTKAKLNNGSFDDLKSVKLTNVDGSGSFSATVDTDSKSSHKFDWNAEEKAYSELTPAIEDPEITAWTESNETKDTATGTFSLKNANEDVTVTTVAGFKSVDVTGTIDNTKLNGVAGQDTTTDKSSKNLSISKGKGSYTKSSTASSKATTSLNVTTATIKGAFSGLKTVNLKDVKVDGAAATFTASLDTDEKESKKIAWNADDATFAEIMAAGPFGESVTSWEWTGEEKNSVVGSFKLANTKDAAVINNAVSIVNFKNVEISGVASAAVGSLANVGDSSTKQTLKRAVSETKRTQEQSESTTATTVGSLKVTGKSASPTTLTLAGGIGYADITLKDAKIVTGGSGVANAYAETETYSAKETATLDSGSATVVDLKVSYTHNTKGNGSFTATAGNELTAFDGALNGFSTISLKDKVSIGDVDNYKYDGEAGDTYKVPFNGEYFDVIAVNYGAEPAPGDEETLLGNISGSYKLDAKGQIESKWTASYATTATGSFTQTASVANVTAGDISGYDKVTLTGVKTAGDISGTNSKTTTVLNYKYAKDEEVANSKVVTTAETSAASVKVAGKTFSGTPQVATAGDITGYKSVTLENAAAGAITAIDQTTVETTDEVNNPGDVVTAVTSKAVGGLTATTSTLSKDVSGFAKVELKNTEAADTVDFAGGDTATVTGSTSGKTTDTATAVGSFSAVSDKRQVVPGDPKLSVVQTIGNVSGFQKVDLKNYNAGDVAVGFSTLNFGGKVKATSVEIIAADDEKETPKTWKKAAATKGNTFTATADSYVDGGTVHQNEITVGAVTGYGKVEATGLHQIGAIENAFITDSIEPGAFVGRIYGVKHYGDWTATAQSEEGKYTAISATAGSGVKIKGVTEGDKAETAVTGNIAGYSTVQLDTVKLGAGAAVIYAGGKYTYTTKTNSDDEVVATSTSTADGKLDIKNATFVADTTFSAEGFKTVAVNIAGAATFTNIIGGTETAQFTGDTLDFTTFKCADKASVTTEDGSVTGKVAGYMEAVFTDTNFSGTLLGYEIGTRKVDGEIEQTYAAKTTVTFDDADKGEDANTIAGTFTNAKSIVFKSSTADASNDFAVTATITSLEGKDNLLTIEVNKCQTTMDLSKFDLNDGDEIKLVSATGAENTATIALGDIANVAALEALIENMSGAKFSGDGNITFSTIDEQDFADTLAAAEITWGDDVKFNGNHYDPTALA